MIEFKNVYKNYEKTSILKDFNLSIDCGEFLCVIGSSASGKTTLLNMINGLIFPDDGEIFIENKSLKDADIIALRRSMGYCIQGNFLFPHLNVFENVVFALKLAKFSHDEIEDRFAWAMDLAQLDTGLRKSMPSQLSGGQQQRVAIARALAPRGKILLMDEPFGAVDEITRANLQRNLKDIHLKTGITIVFVTHDISEAIFLGTRVLVLNLGKIEQFDTPENILQNPRTEFVSQLVKKLLKNSS